MDRIPQLLVSLDSVFQTILSPCDRSGVTTQDFCILTCFDQLLNLDRAREQLP